MPTIGYGEDGLTFHALHARRAELLNALKDRSPPGECLVYYRPSFGRAGGDASPQFGEFDAILCTQKVVYLIESKWNSGNQAQPVVRLHRVQALRHRIFAWLYAHWCGFAANGHPPDWAGFVQIYGQAFTDAFPFRPLAPDGSLLARNLQAILSTITPGHRDLNNVLSFFTPDGIPGPHHIEYLAGVAEPDPTFRLLTLEYTPIGNSRYFWMEELQGQ
jgi:hypothetical protein